MDRIQISLVILIILIGGFLRLNGLENVPNGFYVDEASTGYNAYSLLKTGNDEYGKAFPLAMRFLGSYTPPLYTYLTIIPISWFGLSVTSVRLISAIAGILSIVLILVFLRSLDLFRSRSAILLTLLLFAINPWSIFYSRIGYEIYLGFFLYSLGVIFLWLGLKKIKYLILAAAILSLSTNAYHAERLLAPLTIVTFVILFRSRILLRENMKVLLMSVLAYIFCISPQLIIFLTPANTARGVGLFYQQVLINRAGVLTYLPTVISYPLVFLKEFLAQYFSYFSPRNLFFQPDSDLQRSLPDLSTFYPWMIVFYLLGLFSLIKIWKKDAGKFVLLVLLLAPIPVSLTGDPFSTQRALPLLLPITIIVGLGLDKLISKYKLSLVPILVLCLISLLYLYRSYGVILPNERAKTWGYGFEQLTNEIKDQPNENFIIDTSRMKPAYIELAFYLKFPPDKFQKTIDPGIKEHYYENTRWDANYKFGQIETRSINWEDDIYKPQILMGDEFAISSDQAQEHFLTKVFEIKSPNDEMIFVGYKTNPKLKCEKNVNPKCINI